MKQAVIIWGLVFAAFPAFAAIDCAVLPTCDELGYSDAIAMCPGKYLVCPFDKTKGACQHDAKFGQVGYFIKNPGKGWLKCDGYYYSKNQYPDLFAEIGTIIGGSGNLFRVPDYGGDFLRVYGGNSGSLNQRQKEGLPNIYGRFTGNTDDGDGYFSGAFYISSGTNTGANGGSGPGVIGFDASRSNSIYGASSHVTPVNTAVYAYMYAGKVDSSATSAATTAASCVKGNYIYTDGTCSSSYTSSKTVKGIVNSVSNYTTYTYVQYIRGGVSATSNGSNASDMCSNSGEWLASNYDWKSLPTNISTSQSVVRSVQSGKYYWNYSTSKYYCSSQTSCAASTTAGSSSDSSGGAYYPFYYCYGYMYFAK